MPDFWAGATKPPKKDFWAGATDVPDTGTVLEEEHELAKPHRKALKAMHPDAAARFLKNIFGEENVRRRGYADYEFKRPNEKEWRVLDPSDPELKDISDWYYDLISMVGIIPSVWAGFKGGAAVGGGVGTAVAGPAGTAPGAAVGGFLGAVGGGAGGAAGIEKAKQEYLRAAGYPATPEEVSSKVKEEAIYGALAEPIGRGIGLGLRGVKYLGGKALPTAGKAMQAPVQAAGKIKTALRKRSNAKLEERYIRKPGRATPAEDPTRVPPDATAPSPGASEPPPRPKSPLVKDGLPESPPAPPVDRPVPPVQEGMEPVEAAYKMHLMAQKTFDDANKAINDYRITTLEDVRNIRAARKSGEISWDTSFVLTENAWDAYFMYKDRFWKEASEELLKAGERVGIPRKEGERLIFERYGRAPRMPEEPLRATPSPETPVEAQKPLTEAPVKPGGLSGATQQMAGGRPHGERGAPQEMPGYRHPFKLPQAAAKEAGENVSQTVDEAIAKGFYREKPPTPTSRGILPEAAETEALKRPGPGFWGPRRYTPGESLGVGVPPFIIAAATGVPYSHVVAPAVAMYGGYYVGYILERGVPWLMKVLEKKASPKLMERARMLLGYMTPKEAIRALSSDPEFQQVMESEV